MMVPIEDYPGYMINENGVVINKKGHMMRQALTNHRRPRVALETYDDNGKLVKRTNCSVSRLVAKAFIKNPTNSPLVMHLDNDPLHNHFTNLMWGSSSDNRIHASEEGRITNPYDGPAKSIYLLSNEDGTDIIKCKGREGIANLIGYSESAISDGMKVKNGEYKDYEVVNTGKKVKKVVSFY